MRTVNNQTEGSARPGRFRYEPDRHYVMAQIPDSHWDGGSSLVPTTPDQLLDIWDNETGDFAYRPEAMGADGRSITNSSRLGLISCSKEYAERRQKEIANESRRNMNMKAEPLKLALGQEIQESLQAGSEVMLKTAFQKDKAAKAAQEQLMRE